MNRLAFILQEIRDLRRSIRKARPVSVPELTAELEMIERAAELELRERELRERQQRRQDPPPPATSPAES